LSAVASERIEPEPWMVPGAGFASE